MTAIKDSVVLVTGANRGLGKVFVQELLDRGAAKVYASARTPLTYDDPRVVPLRVDVTDEASIRAAAETASDVSIVINNAGIPGTTPLVTTPIEDIQRILDTNTLGPIRVAKAFAQILAANGGGTLVNVASVLSWLASGAYGASKAALWSVSNQLRQELSGQGTVVQSLHLGYTDTDMTAGIDAPKNDPLDVVRASLEGIERGDDEVLADELTRSVKAGLSGSLARA
ncbi:MAG TPA: SDR family oxidoreductase [Pseudonocardiaceae bacterium]|jgi:NAD(P)-dependent dehydrogenase (short-subunit alcohol dehydrogenase family)|nr:SDR family oxidoreductase [Pseudonocardiaceae bacterium]